MTLEHYVSNTFSPADRGIPGSFAILANPETSNILMLAERKPFVVVRLILHITVGGHSLWQTQDNFRGSICLVQAEDGKPLSENRILYLDQNDQYYASSRDTDATIDVFALATARSQKANRFPRFFALRGHYHGALSADFAGPDNIIVGSDEPNMVQLITASASGIPDPTYPYSIVEDTCSPNPRPSRAGSAEDEDYYGQEK